MPAIRVYILNDHPLFVQVLAHYLADFSDLKVVGTGLRGQAAYNQLKELQPDVIIVDPGPKLADIAPTISQVRAAAPRAILVSLTQNFDEGYDQVAYKAGVQYFIEKLAAAEELVMTIRGARVPVGSPRHLNGSQA